MAQGYKGFQEINRDATRRLQALNKQTENHMKTKVENLKLFCSFLFKYPSITGYMEDNVQNDVANGEIKQKFKKLGKKAFADLAEYIGLKEYKVDFNPGGPAVSGDLTLRGMFTTDKGIYITMSRDGMGDRILYRSIKKMQDFTGGNNNYLADGELNHPEEIKVKVHRLLKLDAHELTLSDSNEFVPGEKMSSEQWNKEVQDKINTKDFTGAAILIKHIVAEIISGKHIELTPDLILKMQHYKLPKYLRAQGITGIYDNLFNNDDFKKHVTKNIWNLIPDSYKKSKHIDKVEWKAEPGNNGLLEIVKSFFGKDPLKPSIIPANFEKAGIVATDATKLIFINEPWKGETGLYCLTPECFISVKADTNPVKVNQRFPEYVSIVPTKSATVINQSLKVLQDYCSALIKSEITGEKFLSAFEYTAGQLITVQADQFLCCIEAFLKLGYDTIDIGIDSPKKLILLTPPGKNQEAAKQNTVFALLMPIGTKAVTVESLEDGHIYFALLDHVVKTTGVSEGIILENFKTANTAGFPSNPSVNSSHEILNDRKNQDTLSMLTGDAWFKQHPEKILGDAYQVTNRFGRPETRIKGTIENIINGIDVPTVEQAKTNKVVSQTLIKEPLQDLMNEPEKKKNIERVIQQTKKLHNDKALRLINGEKESDCPEGTYCFDDILSLYNKGISEDEIKAWIWYKRKTGGFNDEKVILNKDNGWSKFVIPINEIEKYRDSWMTNGILCYHEGSYIPSVLYYAENIYERETSLLKEKDEIVSKLGQAQFERQWEGLAKIKPSSLNLTDPSKDDRLFIKPDSHFAQEIFIHKLADGSPLSVYSAKEKGFVKGAVSLVDAFKEWLKTLPKDDFKKSNDWDIRTYYLDGATPSKNHDKAEKLRLKQNAKMEGDQFFVRFLYEAITREDQLRIEQLWNSRFNGYVEVNYFKVPIAFTCSNTFKNKPLFIREVQREGIGFLNVQGSGCIAYDVGLGKTMTAILALAQAMEMGQCKRPLIVVPNQTYKNWLGEIRGVVDQGKVSLTGLIPQYQVLDLYNLGADYIEQLHDDKGNIKPVPEFCITVVTYEGFNRLSFGEETWKEIGDELYSILNQGVDKKRDQAVLFEKIDEMMGKGAKGGMVNIEDLGFDFAIVDEAHAMKKAFTKVKGEMAGDDEKREKSSYEISSGEPSMTALRGFMISQYIQRHNKMRNVVLLTATPFTNSPLEIYSILSLIGYQQLEKWGVKNIKQFFDTFIKTSTELVINAKLKPERKEIVLGFHNLIALQQLIYKFINYKSGEDAQIQRPNKIVLPLVSRREGDKIIPLPLDEQISTNLSLTAEQKGYMSDVEDYVRGKVSLQNFCINPHGYEDNEENDGNDGEELEEENLSDEEKDGTRILRGLSFARQLSLSPYLYACNPNHNPTSDQYIETSPKLKYVMECIRSVKLYHEAHNEDVSGQVIYMNAGVHFFPLLKDYLINKIGYSENEVGIIKSGMSSAKKEGIKERFLAGSVKIIIGSASIKEGINLQTRATTLYNCWPDWNPTDAKQLEGRIWRFGNIFANVRIVNPLMEDSIDTFIFQKQQEKTSRINEIWFRAGKSNTLNLEEFNPSEIKMGLITDPLALAELILMSDREKLLDEITGINNQKKVLEDIAEQREIYNKNIDHVKQTVNRYKPVKEAGQTRSIETIFKIFRDFLDDENADHTYQDTIVFDLVRKANSTIKRGVEQILQPRGLDIAFDVKKLTVQMDKDIEKTQKTMEDKTGENAVKIKAAQIIQDRIIKGYKPKSVAERVQEFSSLNDKVLSELMVYDKSDEAKGKQNLQQRKGEALEGTADRLTKIIHLREVFTRMKERMVKIKQMRSAA